MFIDMQQDYNRLKEEYDEAVRVVAKYQEEVHQKKEELKGAAEVVVSCRQSLLSLEKEKKHAGLEKDRARVDLEQAKVAL